VQKFNPGSRGCPDSAAGFTVFEPLMLTDMGHHKVYPWLAARYHWSKDFIHQGPALHTIERTTLTEHCLQFTISARGTL
jgi:hypothetical protein